METEVFEKVALLAYTTGGLWWGIGLCGNMEIEISEMVALLAYTTGGL